MSEEDERAFEVELLMSMLDVSEIRKTDTDCAYSYEIDITIDSPAVPITGVAVFHLNVELLDGYPMALPLPELTIRSDQVRRGDLDVMRKDLFEYLDENSEDPMKVVLALNWVREFGEKYIKQVETNSNLQDSSSTGPKNTGNNGILNSKRSEKQQFLREWVSFPCFYKDSYISGPNRFELMIDLAQKRNLNITGRGIAGKPGGMVAEGRENDMERFMDLMRTEWLETWNPRGRKLSTRLQERFPFDREEELFELASILYKNGMKNPEQIQQYAKTLSGLPPGTGRDAKSSAIINVDPKSIVSSGVVKTISDAEFLDKFRKKYPEYWTKFFLLLGKKGDNTSAVGCNKGGNNYVHGENANNNCNEYYDEENRKVSEKSNSDQKNSDLQSRKSFLDVYRMGHPSTYFDKILDDYTDEELESQRLFNDFKIITEEDGGYKEGARVLKGIGAHEGMDAIFTYRFS